MEEAHVARVVSLRRAAWTPRGEKRARAMDGPRTRRAQDRRTEAGELRPEGAPAREEHC